MVLDEEIGDTPGLMAIAKWKEAVLICRQAAISALKRMNEYASSISRNHQRCEGVRIAA